MGMESLIPLGLNVVGALAKGGGGVNQQQQQQQAAAAPVNPFPMNMPDGGRRGPSMLDAYGPASLAPVMPGQQFGQQQDAMGNLVPPDVGGQPLSILDLLRQGSGRGQGYM